MDRSTRRLAVKARLRQTLLADGEATQHFNPMQRSLSSVPSYSDFALARYNGDGSPDVTADTCGISHRQAQNAPQNLGIFHIDDQKQNRWVPKCEAGTKQRSRRHIQL
jgi:hypothetical protein